MKTIRSSNGFPTKIYLLDKHPMLRQGLIRALAKEKGIIVCGENGDAALGLKAISALRPKLVIMGLIFPGTGGLQLVKKIRTQSPETRIVVFTALRGSFYPGRCFTAGAKAFVGKKEPVEGFIKIMRRVIDGDHNGGISSNDFTHDGGSALSKEPAAALLALLSERELEVFQHIGKGLGTREIARELGLSRKTIESYREHLKQKLNLDHTHQVLKYAIQFALLTSLEA